MDEVEFKQGPLLAGWAIAAGVGLVALGVARVVGDFDLTPAVAIAAVLFLIVGVVLGLPRAGASAAPEGMAASHHAGSFAAPAPLMAAPAAAPSRSAAPAPLMSATPAPLMAEAAMAPQRPLGMTTARDGTADDLKEINGVGPVLEKLLHSLGYFHFDQIAAWTAAEVAWVDDNLEGFKGRVTRDDWVPQARLLAAGGSTEHSRRVASGEIT
jgi:predicted flap endonuclease-1-like 5' DNA nuclease